MTGEPLQILVYEHVSGGGFASEPIPPNLLSEGFAMLRGVISHFQAAGHGVTALLDSRLASFNPPVGADRLMLVSSTGEAKAIMEKCCEFADAAYVIAPEPNLQSIVDGVESTSLRSLNCRARGIEKAANKASLCEHMKQIGLHAPETLLFNTLDNAEEITKAINDKMGFPVVFKPMSGAGCGGLSLVRNQNHVAAAIGKIRRDSANECFMVQELIDGVAASVSLISTGSEALPVSLNKQDVTLGTPESDSSYVGGLVPLDTPLRDEVFAVAKKVVESFEGLRGYVGVDLVLTEDAAFVVDVNPRLTTSYVGLWKVACFNPAEALLNAVLKGKLPENVRTSGYACFSKIAVPNPAVAALQESYKMCEVVSPPFPVANGGAACALVESHGATVQEAMLRFGEAKKHLQLIISGGT